MDNPVKLFIVEGESRDYRFVNEMTTCFFKGRYTAKVIALPAAQNIYMLYKKLTDDHFETDIVEILRENVNGAKEKLAGLKRQEIDEVYLFFDYDIQQNNTSFYPLDASEIVDTMLDVFNNETENGKLYISYPMVEALYDYQSEKCAAFSNCFISIDELKQYKNLTGTNNPYASRTLDFLKWQEILNVFYLRIKCLFDISSLDYMSYRKKVSPKSIYHCELALVNQHKQVFVLSSFPEFLFDYFKANFWESMTPIKKNKYEICPKIN